MRLLVCICSYKFDYMTTRNLVFLGGACNPTTWRQKHAIPFLEEAGINFYNPVTICFLCICFSAF
ncbi:unnamed protein product [Schistocephalus solidus]|uniref:Uncharacterized protein n=1 Tax=Schistocephalus solidus TaxID=70667 RepID=A0A3P7EAU8_SCHSO|nr:unnamed protein product [Schistocephalus solidus]